MSIAETLALRPRQILGKNLVHAKWREGHKRVLYVCPTGSGKRYQGVWWAKAAQDRPDPRDTLIVTDRRILVKQMYEELHRFGVDFGVIMGDHEENRLPTCQVASIQSLRERYFEKPEELPRASLIIVDEAHKERDAYEFLFKLYPDAMIVGLTATPVGSQGKALTPDLYDVMVEGAKNSELIADGLLLPTDVYAPSEPNIKGMRLEKSGEFNQVKLGKAVKSVTCFADLWKEWMPFSDRQTIVFAPGVDYAYGLAGSPARFEESFYTHGIDAAVIEAKTSQSERDEMFEKFSRGELRVLVSVDVLREGFDAPIASCGIDLQPNGQLRTYWQKVGRIKRAYEGQTEAVWIDMAGNYWRFPHPNHDPAWGEVTAAVSTQDVIAARREKGEEPQPVMCPKCSYVRQGGPKCPKCGHEAERAVRRIRMGQGKLKLVTAKEKKKVEKSERQKLIDKWKREVYAGVNGRKTMEQARVSFRRRNGRWPPLDLPGMPPFGSVEWGRYVEKVYPKDKIESIFKGEA